MVDRPARDRAAALVRDFRDGRIDNDRFADDFPARSDDRALRAIYSMLWYSYDDLHRHRLTGKHALTPMGTALFDRCIAFLESDEEYAWPIDDFVGTWAGPLLLLIGLCTAFGLAGYYAWPALLPAGLLHWREVREIGLVLGGIMGGCLWLPWLFVMRRRNRRIEARYPADVDAWPFTSKERALRQNTRPRTSAVTGDDATRGTARTSS